MSLTIASPKECWETLSSQISQLGFERDLNKIASLTNADRASRVVIIYLHWVSWDATLYHPSQHLPEEEKSDLSTVSLWGLYTYWTVVQGESICIMTHSPFP